MITGIYPLLNHAVTQIVKFDMIHSLMHMCILCIHDCRHSSITQSCDNTSWNLTWFTHVYIEYIIIDKHLLLKSIQRNIIKLMQAKIQTARPNGWEWRRRRNRLMRIYAGSRSPKARKWVFTLGNLNTCLTTEKYVLNYVLHDIVTRN